MQHEENRGIGMVVADGADGVEATQIVFVRRVVAVPCDDIERLMIHLGGPEISTELCD